MTWAHKARGSEGGEPDETGFPREGYALGDLAGAVSLSIPMEVYEAEARERTMANVSLFGALAAVIVAVAVAVNGALRRQGRQMEAMNDKLEEANGHLERMNDALRQKSEYKSTFLATMSHELKTPLASTIALVKEMAELLGGRATVESEVGVGSVFRASHPGAVMGKDELIEELWGEEYLDGAISIAVYVRKIREKIEENPAKPAYLKTVWGVGYSFEA